MYVNLRDDKKMICGGNFYRFRILYNWHDGGGKYFDWFWEEIGYGMNDWIGIKDY